MPVMGTGVGRTRPKVMLEKGFEISELARESRLKYPRRPNCTQSTNPGIMSLSRAKNVNLSLRDIVLITQIGALRLTIVLVRSILTTKMLRTMRVPIREVEMILLSLIAAITATSDGCMASSTTISRPETLGWSGYAVSNNYQVKNVQ